MFKIYLSNLKKQFLIAALTLFSIWTYAQTCTTYTVGNVNNFCGCTSVLFVPYGLYLETPNGCVEYFKADTVAFIISSDSSAYLKGTFRSFNDFRPVLVDLRFAKTRTKVPRLELCNRDSSLNVAANWRYFGSMSGTIKFDADPIVTVSSRNGLFQMGVGATGQNATIFGAAGQFSLSNGRVGGFGFPLTNPQPVTCPAPVNPCLTDAEPPSFTNCPANITVTTPSTTAVANWTAPTATDNCSTPSVSANFSSGQSFPIGLSNVVYTAVDAAGNRSECRFSVTVTQVIPVSGCVEYSVNNTNNFCGCTVSQFTPYGVYLQSANTCGSEYYQVETAKFRINADSTATLQGTFRSSNWTPLVVDIFFQKTTLKLPKFELCNRDSSASIAATWRYFGNMTGTIKLGTDAATSVSSRNGLFQVGSSANGQNYATLGASGQFTMSNGQQGGFGFSMSNPQNVSCLPPPNFCLNDAIPPTFNNCPANISITTATTTGVATWTAPTATDNCSTPSVSSNFLSGQAFQIGTTNVVYTAKDSLNNTSECRFTVTVRQVLPPTGCIKYTVDNTNNYCGCTPLQFTPYGIYLQSSNACGSEYYKADSVVFQISTDSTATLRGTFRSQNWTPLVVDIFLSKTTLKLPKFELCNRDSSAVLAAAWRYFGNMIGTIKIGTDLPVSVSSRNGLFQLGVGANGQNANLLGASGQFTLGNGQQGGFGFSLVNPQNAICLPPPNFCLNDVIPPTFTNCPADISITTALTSAPATWTAPTATDNCTTPSVSSNFSSGQTFPLGTTNVIYTAKDSANNIAQCRFSVTVRQVIPPTGCVKYAVDNTNNNCGCAELQYTPYGFYVENTTNSCGLTYYKADSVIFQINADSTAYLKGIFRNQSWQPITVDIFFQKTALKLPKREFCIRDSATSIAANWRYFGDMIGTIKFDNQPAVSVVSRNGVFQFGNSANGQNRGTLGASGQFTMGNGMKGGFAFGVSNPQNVTCSAPPNFCLNDVIPPTFNECPADIVVGTRLTTAVATWTAPTATDNCTTPSVSSNYQSGRAFPIGTTYVVYTAIDAANNRAECRFAVTVNQTVDLNCKRYDVLNSQNICGCAASQWTPFGFYLENPTSNGCNIAYFKSDDAAFQINEDSSATLKGTFRTPSWQPVFVNVTFAKTTFKAPKLEGCNRDSAASIAANWRYFGAMRGIMQFDTSGIYNVSSGTNLTQFGVGANNQNVRDLGVSGSFTMSNGQKGGFTFALGAPQAVACTIDPNPCLNDITKPRFNNCPSTVNVGTLTTSAVANWVTPSAFDNCSTPSVSSNFQSGQTFQLGVTTVIYTATDVAGNSSACSFAVNVFKIPTPTGCNSYTAENTLNACGCADLLWKPYGLYLEAPNSTCGLEYFKADSVVFVTNLDSTGSLKGRFRSAAWLPVFVDIKFARTLLKTPRLENCNRDSMAAVAAEWRYLGAMTGTVRFDTGALIAINSRNGGLQFGRGASGQNPNLLSASGQFSLANGRLGGFAFQMSNPQVLECPFVPGPCYRDTIAPVFNNCPTNINVVTSQNSVAINWTTPTARDNCSTPLILSNFQPGQLLPIGQTTVVYLARDTSGNQTECRFIVTVTKVTPTQDLTNTPFEIIRFSPNPTSDILKVDATSPLEGVVVFNLINALGQVLEQKTQTLKLGDNQLIFDVSHLAKGVYWLKPAAINGQKAMIKFVKM
jgi:hypothetical protein